jgi:hypothetical protein
LMDDANKQAVCDADVDANGGVWRRSMRDS